MADTAEPPKENDNVHPTQEELNEEVRNLT